MRKETKIFIDNLSETEKAEVLEYILLEFRPDKKDEILTELENLSNEYHNNFPTGISWPRLKIETLRKWIL